MLPQVLEQQRALASMVQQMRLELVAYRRELVRDPDIARTGRSLTRWPQEWQSRCLGALYRYLGVVMPEPAMDMHMPPPPPPPHMHAPVGPHGHPNMMHGPPDPQGAEQQRIVFEQATQMYEMARMGGAPVRKAL